mgnify:CR=1 FL=1
MARFGARERRVAVRERQHVHFEGGTHCFLLWWTTSAVANSSSCSAGAQLFWTPCQENETLKTKIRDLHRKLDQDTLVLENARLRVRWVRTARGIVCNEAKQGQCSSCLRFGIPVVCGVCVCARVVGR